MFLGEIIDTSVQDLRVVREGYFKVLNMNYGNYKVDPRPLVVQLGKWRHPSTGNMLVGGINLNYLSDDQLERLRKYGPDLLQYKNLKNRYWRGRSLLPDVFDSDSGFYRTYNQDYIRIIDLGSLRFLSPKELRDLGRIGDADKLLDRRMRLLAAKKAKRPVDIDPDEIEPQVPPEEPTEPAPEEPPEDDVAAMARTAVSRAQEEPVPAPEPVPKRRRMRTLTPPELVVPEPKPEPEPELKEPEVTEPEIAEPVPRPEPRLAPGPRGRTRMRPLEPEVSSPEEEPDLSSGSPARPRPTRRPRPTERPEEEEEPGAPESAEE